MNLKKKRLKESNDIVIIIHVLGFLKIIHKNLISDYLNKFKCKQSLISKSNNLNSII